MPANEFTFGSLFAGIGGIDLGLERAGMVCGWQVEIDPFCLKVLKKRWPDVERFGDVKECGKRNLKAVDLVCGGFPCQDVSVAGKRKGLEGERSGLWFEMLRIVRELEPRWVLVENVPGLLSVDSGGGFGTVLRDLAESGYDAEWDVIPAKTFGAPHTRERIFIIAHANGERREIPSQRHGAFRLFERVPTEMPWISELPESAICGIDDGIPDRVDRLRTLGNAVVPQVAEWIARRILEADERWTR